MKSKQVTFNNDAYLPTIQNYGLDAPPNPQTPFLYIPSPQFQVPISCSGCLRLSRVLNFRPTKCKMVPSSRSLLTIREGGEQRSSLSSRRRRRTTQSNFAHPSSILFIPLPHTLLPVSSSTRGKPFSPPSFLSTLPQSAAVIHIVDVKYRLTITDQVVSSSTNKRST